MLNCGELLKETDQYYYPQFNIDIDQDNRKGVSSSTNTLDILVLIDTKPNLMAKGVSE